MERICRAKNQRYVAATIACILQSRKNFEAGSVLAEKTVTLHFYKLNSKTRPRAKCAILSWHAVMAALKGEAKPVSTENEQT